LQKKNLFIDLEFAKKIEKITYFYYNIEEQARMLAFTMDVLFRNGLPDGRYF